MTTKKLTLDESQPFHASAVVVGGKGIVITGASGSGKTALALATIRRARQAGLDATLVADDQIFLRITDTGMSLHRPEPLAGLVEIRGHGVLASGLPHCEQAPGALWIELGMKTHAERYQSGNLIAVNGISIAYRALWEGDREHAVTVILTALGHPVWY